MQDPNHSASFWIGNALLGLALVVLIFQGRLWEMMGSLAMLLWMGMAGAGIYLVTRDKGPSS